VRIALDDFGSGYSSLSYLRQFAFDNIKIDRSFVKDITESTSSRCIVHAIAEMASGLSIIATAEGVETAEQRAAVLDAGCAEMQGFLVSRALPAKEIEQLFVRSGMTAGNETTPSDPAPGAPDAGYDDQARQRYV
jgi:EAL domain-containing protein (putative c-di-GMP-specific phosphodiesterase class I)